MTYKHTLLLSISIVCCVFSTFAQQKSILDTSTVKEKYGLRVGVDLSKPIRTLLDEDYSGFEVVADFRVSDKFYAAAELGTESFDFYENNLNALTKGSYIKVGANYNAYNNWIGLHNEIFTGLRYGFATFDQELLAYRIYTTDQNFPPTVRTESEKFDGLTAHWLEFTVGIKAEIFNNLYISASVQLKHEITEDKPENFDNLFVPGFGKTYDFSSFGVGYGYSISYLIPLFKK